jgi:hypothetical protein
VTISATNPGGTDSAKLTLTVDYNGLKGAYSGLVALDGTDSGLFTLSLTPKGGFTGKLKLAGVSYPLKGTLSSTGTFGGSMTTGGTTLNVALTLDPTVPEISGTITATSTNGVNAYIVDSGLAGTFKASTLPVGLAGRYTVVIPAVSGTGAGLPDMPGYGTMTVSTKGAISISGKLGDGTAFSAKSQLNADGKTWTLFELLYGKKSPGSIAGTMTFASGTNSDCTGMITWLKPPQASGSYYPKGFSITANLMAATYSASTPASSLVNFALGGGDLAEPAVSGTLTFIPATNKVTVSGTNDVALTLTPSTGAFSGHFLYPGTDKKTLFDGVIYQKPSLEGLGLFPGADQYGGVEITP